MGVGAGAEVGQCVQLECSARSLHSTQKEVCFPFHRTCVTSLWRLCQMGGGVGWGGGGGGFSVLNAGMWQRRLALTPTPTSTL